MKKLKPLAEKQITLTAGQLDLRTPSGRASEGYFRLLVNAISDSRGRLKRMGGWRRLTLTPSSPDTTFAVVGDFGFADANQRAVASMITGWNPEFVVTTGDNIYGLTNTMTLAQADARFNAVIDSGYRSYYTAGTLYPVIGNHDTDYDPTSPAWFRGKFSGLFGSKNYYRKRQGPVEFFMLSSGIKTGGGVFEPDGNTVGSTQYQWLETALADSTATFKVVVLHHPPYTSDQNYSPGETDLRWNFEALGADIVLSGHAHNYERRKDRDIPYVISGNGGASLRGYTGVDTEVSVVDDPPRFGALRCVVNDRSLRIQSITVDGETIDEFELCKGTNEDLHDQLQTNYDDGRVIVRPPTIPVTPPDVDVGVEAVVPAELPEIEVTWSEPCDYDLLIDVEPAETDFSSKIGWVSVNQLEPASGVTEINFDGSGVISGGCTMAYLPGVTRISYPNATEFAPANWGWGVSLQLMPDLVEFNAPLLESTALIRIQNCPLITELSFPLLTSGFAYLINAHVFIITGNSALTTIDIGSFTPLNNHRGNFSNNSLSAATVNHILARFASSPTWANTLNLSGGTNAAPTGQGIIDRDALIARGAVVTTN